MYRRNLITMTAMAAAALTLAMPATASNCSSGHETKAHTHAEKVMTEAKQTMTIVETAVAAGSFKTLVAAVQAADLVDVLQGDGPFTVFAPTDEAFAKLPEGTIADLLKPENKEKLQAILTYHVVAGKVTSEDVVALESAKTVQGQDIDINVEDGAVMIDNAMVTQVDITASNGVIHVIDNVILPEL
jgi:uncharacterized surface protein with fasciclin (FAS1) repeats